MGNTGAVPRVYILIVHIASRRQHSIHDVEGTGTRWKQQGRRCWNSTETVRWKVLEQCGNNEVKGTSPNRDKEEKKQGET